MRLDKYLAEKFSSRTKAVWAIKNGLVLVNGKKAEPSYDYKEGDTLQIISAQESYVSQGGYKLSKALKDFNFSVKDKVIIDIGASTGGFTHCLLLSGAKKVYCIDVGESQLDKSLVCDKTVVIDNFNARNLNKDIFAEKVDGVVIDVSFISLTYILKNVSEVLSDGGFVIALIKPQFECESRNVGKNGIVKDPKTHEKIILKVVSCAFKHDLIAENLTNAPIIEGKNYEYLVLLTKSAKHGADIQKLIDNIKL